MIIEVGVTAGEIITLLEEIKDPLTVKEIEVYLGEDKDRVLMSIGSLIREGLLETDLSSGPSFYRLKKSGKN